MSARIAALLTAGALLAAAQPALADDHLPEIEAETVWVDESDAWGMSEQPVSIAYESEMPRAPQGYRWVRASEVGSASAGPRYGYNEAEREAWLADCTIMLSERQYDYDDYYNDDADGGLIGGLLGAIVGGVAGNRIADGDRLLGTLIGGGIGGIAGAVIGTALDGDDDSDAYDEYDIDPYAAEYCGAYLRRYEAQGLGAIAGHGGYGPAMAHSAPMAQGRVIRRRNCRPCQEEVIEEIIVEEPTAARAIPPRRTAPPAPTKLIPVK
jgi:hypothetical protein